MIQDDGYLFDSVSGGVGHLCAFGSTLINFGMGWTYEMILMRNGIDFWYSATFSILSFFLLLFFVQEVFYHEPSCSSSFRRITKTTRHDSG